MTVPLQMITAREALNTIIAVGRSTREAASFISEQCYEQRMHAWAFVNTDELSLFPHHVWPILMWAVLPDKAGVIHDEGEKISVVGNWFDGRISYWEKYDGQNSVRYNIQGLRFDRLEFDAIKLLATGWSSQIIDAKPLGRIETSAFSPHSDADLRAWMAEQPRMKADLVFDQYKSLPHRSRVKREEFRKVWSQVHCTKRGRPSR